jgi:hypothetical protein
VYTGFLLLNQLNFLEMANTGIPHDVDNLTTTAPSTSDMSKAEADKTVVKGIAHKYEGAVKVRSRGAVGLPFFPLSDFLANNGLARAGRVDSQAFVEREWRAGAKRGH